ncbi:uncharacterized protein METZ01_LOCUS123869, partial [marine metagenome]
VFILATGVRFSYGLQVRLGISQTLVIGNFYHATSFTPCHCSFSDCVNYYSSNPARNTIMEAQLVRQSCGTVAHGVGTP